MHYVWTIIAQQSDQNWFIRNAPWLSVLVASASAIFAFRSSKAAARSAQSAEERDHREREPKFVLIDEGHHTGTGISMLRLRQVSGPQLREVKFRVNELKQSSSPSEEYYPGRVLLRSKWTIGGDIGQMHLHKEAVLKVKIDGQRKEDFYLILRCIATNGEWWDVRAEVPRKK